MLNQFPSSADNTVIEAEQTIIFLETFRKHMESNGNRLYFMAATIFVIVGLCFGGGGLWKIKSDDIDLGIALYSIGIGLIVAAIGLLPAYAAARDGNKQFTCIIKRLKELDCSMNELKAQFANLESVANQNRTPTSDTTSK